MRALEELYEDALAQLPAKRDAHIVLNNTLCTSPPHEIETARLKVVPWPLGHGYGDSARYDLIHIFGDKTTYRRLGLLLLATVFHPNRQTTLYLRHPETVVTKLRIECSTADSLNPKLRGMASMPTAYGYEAIPVGHIHPLWREDWRIQGDYEKYTGRDGYHLPHFYLTNEGGRCGNEASFASRNIVDGFGGPDATATLAALLLDIGLLQTELTEFYLESPSGNWSVAIGSAEARLWVGYDYD